MSQNTAKFDPRRYTCIDTLPAAEQKASIQTLSLVAVKESRRAGEPITARLTFDSVINAALDGLKAVTINGWFVEDPSGMKNVYKEAAVVSTPLDSIQPNDIR